MEKSPQSPIFIVSEQPKSSLLERALTFVGLAGGGVLGTYYGVKAYGPQASSAQVDVTAQAASEMERAEQAMNVAGKVSANNIVQQQLRQLSPNLELAPELYETAVVAGENAASVASEAKIVSANTAKHLWTLVSSDTLESGISGVTYARNAEGQLSAKIHLDQGGHFHLPHIDENPYSTVARNLKQGASVFVSNPTDIAMLGAAHGPIDSALNKRRAFLAAELPGGSLEATWGSLKKLDGAGRFNVAGMALMGVVFGGFLADIAKSMVRGISHMGTTAPARSDTLSKPR